MIRPCPLTVECPGSEFGTELFGNGDNPFLNLSIERPCVGPQCWEPPPTEYFTAEGFCCDGIRKFAYGDTQALANAALGKKISEECIVCDPNPPKQYCADAKCPDGTLIARVCLTSSYADALAEANRIKSVLGKFCPNPDGFQSTCSCSDGTHTITVHHDRSQDAANALCASTLVGQCGGGQDSGPNPDGPGPNPNPNPHPNCCDPGPPPPVPPTPGTFCNAEMECTVFCPDGLPFTKKVPAGTFCGETTQKKADDRARTYACQRAAIETICIGDLDLWPCLWTEASANITMSGLGNLTIDLIGDLPQGMTLEQISNTVMRISGTPEEAGIFDFQIIVADTFGNAQVKDFSLSVFGVDWDARNPLPEGAVGLCYDHQFTALGPYVAPLIWQFVNIPDGLTHDGNGRISGTPTTAGDFNAFGLFLSDSDEPFRNCFYQLQQHIRDCGTDTYGGVDTGFLNCHDIRPFSVFRTVAIPKQICARAIHFYCDCNILGCPSTLFVQFRVLKNGLEQVVHNGSNSGPFAKIIDQHTNIPAQYPASGTCPAAPGFSDVWTVEVKYSVSASNPIPACAGTQYTIDGL